MSMRYFLIGLTVFSANILADGWQAATRTIFTNAFSGYYGSSSVQFSDDLRGYLWLRYFNPDPEVRSYYIWATHPSLETEFVSYSDFSTNYRVTHFEISGQAQRLLYCTEDALPYTCKLYVEGLLGLEQFQQDDGSVALFTRTPTYTGARGRLMSYDGSLVASGTSCCGQWFYGVVEAWKKLDDNIYHKVVSQTREVPDQYDRPKIGGSLTVSDYSVATLLDATYSSDIPESEIFIYQVDNLTADDEPLSSPSSRIRLPKAIYGVPAETGSIDLNRAGNHVAVATWPDADANIPAPRGAVAVFSQSNGEWTQKGQLIDPQQALTGFDLEHYVFLASLGESGNSIAVSSKVNCFDDNEDLISPCFVTIVTLWDYDAGLDRWIHRSGEGLPISIPFSDEMNDPSPADLRYLDGAGKVGLSIYDQAKDYLMITELERDQTSGGLPIWLLYEASQQE